MPIISDQGLATHEFDHALAVALGAEHGREGARLLEEAARHGRQRVELCDWVYCLARYPQSILYKTLVSGRRADPDGFIQAIEAGLDHPGAPRGGRTPKRLVPAAVSRPVLDMLEDARRRASRAGADRIREQDLLNALLDAGDDLLVENLGYSVPPDVFERFRKALASPQAEVAPFHLFDADGALQLTRLAPSAKALCRRLAEDAASLRTGRVTTRHVLYSLLSADSNALVSALVSIGIKPKTDLIPSLTTELSRPGRGRLEGFRLSPETVFGTIPLLFERAYEFASADGEALLSEYHVVRAILDGNADEILRLLPSERVADLDRIRRYVESASPSEAEDVDGRPRLSVAEIERHMREAIVGQDRAIDRVMPWIKRLRFGLPRGDRPAAVLLFLGPTGSGKTQLAKELARHVFGSAEQMIFLEMGQFQTKESMSGFVGAPPGYVGYGEGLLTNGLRDHPEAVVLFDEIEKAHTQVFDTLLRFADEGLISDPAGPVRDGRQCIIVMTTNAGQQWLREHLAEHPGARENGAHLAERLFDAAMTELRERGFRPEFLGRVDERITFLPFTESGITSIVNSLLTREIERFRDLKGIEIQTTDAVRSFLGEAAFRRCLDEGARGAPRAINEYVVTPVIDLVCDHEEELQRTGNLRLAVSTRGTGEQTRILVELI